MRTWPNIHALQRLVFLFLFSKFWSLGSHAHGLCDQIHEICDSVSREESDAFIRKIAGISEVCFDFLLCFLLTFSGTMMDLILLSTWHAHVSIKFVNSIWRKCKFFTMLYLVVSLKRRQSLFEFLELPSFHKEFPDFSLMRPSRNKPDKFTSLWLFYSVKFKQLLRCFN